MKTRQILLTMLAIGLCHCFVLADGLTNISANPIKKIGDYSMMRGTNGHYIFVNPSEFWNGVWKEGTNGWRVQLRVYMETNFWVPQERVMYPVSTNLMLRVEWGSPVKNSGNGYFLTPNGKFAKFELRDIHGNVVLPNPNAGTNLLERILKSHTGLLSFPDISRKLVYETNLPSWVSPSSGSLVADFPETISTNVYPRIESSGVAGKIDSDIQGETGSATNMPPIYVGLLKLDEVYSITNAGDYALTVQPVLYKRYNLADNAILERVDLPSVTTHFMVITKKYTK